MIITNHLNVIPNVTLTGSITAFELLEPSGDGSMSAHKVFIPPDEAYPPHTHPAAHVIAILSGNGTVEMGDADDIEFASIGPGDMFLVPANVRHRVGAGPDGMIMLAVSVASLPLIDPNRLVVVS